ncbi:hypothetical protein [Lentzea flava]|uniref:LPXTG-motif cell wall anchor domain-containing protein n=1 Tax=Lentzea flava TaxID=103732 RepID=A0ABQ2UFH3_9PSEU|nr:hypothetical protein [Lentzea flava]MCP2197774.1 hypothetical protein [Lentzea flava]GGU22081.1 hypothetical protein GCM10010178_12990 [Lentzea flava]
MRKNLNRTMSAALLTGGIMVATAGFAQAIPLPINVDDEVRVGNLVSVPVKICGNAVNVLGQSDATCDSAPKAADQRTMADKALVSAPVTVCGNSVGVAGGGNGSCGETKPEPPNGTVEAPVTVCGTSAAVLGTASGDCGKSEGPGEEPPGEEPPGEQPPGQNPPGQNPPGTTPPGQTPPDNGGNPGGGNNGGDNNSGGGHTGDDSGAGVPQTGNKASNQASPIPNLSRTGADPLEFLLVGLGLMTAGVMARRGARRVTKA